MSFSSSPISRRAVLAGGLAAATTLLLTSCFRPGGGGGPSASADEFRIAWWGGEARTAKMNEILDLFEKQGGATISREFADYNAYWERFATQAAARNLPDLMSMTEQQVGQYATQLEDLQPYVDAGKLDLSSWDPKYIEAGTVDGRLLNLFLGGTIPSLAVNETAVAAAGLGDPNDWSWEDFSDATLALVSKGVARWGSTDNGGVSQHFDSYLHQRGKGLIVDGALGWVPADLEEWLTHWHELRSAGGTPPIDVTSEMTSAPFEDTLLVRGDVVLQSANHNHVPILQTYVSDTLGSATVPVFAGGDRAAVNAGTYVALSANSAAHEKCVEYLDWFVNTPEVITIFQAEYGGLPSPDAAAILEPSLEPAVAKALSFYNSVEPVAQIVPNWPQGALQFLTLVREANENVALGTSPEEAAAACYEQTETAIS
jgi:multiple sugar transport system substrate-binding protein